MAIVTYIPDQTVSYDANGVRESGGKLTFYLYGTLTKTDVYQDPDGTPSVNPVLSLSNGTWPEIYWESSIRTRVIKTSPAGSTAPATWEVKDIGGSGTSGGGGSEVANIEALRDLEGEPEGIVTTLGYTAAGDGGGGNFLADLTDTTSDDNGVTIIVTVDNVRMKLQYSGPIDFRQMGAIGDSEYDPVTDIWTEGTDNSDVFNRFNVWARAESTAGRSVWVFVPSGYYSFDLSLCFGFMYGILDLRWECEGRDTTGFRNTYPGATSYFTFAWSAPWQGIINSSGATFVGVTVGSQLAWRLNNAIPGDTQITFTTAGNAAAVSVGEEFLVTSFDTQFYGLPGNPGHQEWVTAVTVNTGTGVVTLERPIQYYHLTTYPDGGNAYPIGKPRAFKLSFPLTIYTDVLDVPWNVHHVYSGMRVVLGAGVGAYTYITQAGEYVEFKDCILPGVSPSVAKEVVFDHLTALEDSEPDKIVGSIVLKNGCSFPEGFTLQSASIEAVHASDSYFNYFGAGAKYTIATNCEIDNFYSGPTFGIARTVTVNGGLIHAYLNYGNDAVGNPLRSINGGLVTYTNGVISVTKAANAQMIYWGLPPGTSLNLLNSSDQFPAGIGYCMVQSVAEDATSLLLSVSWNFNALPAWASATGKTAAHQQGEITFNDVSGCDLARQQSLCSELDQNPWEFATGQFVGFPQTDGNFTPLVGTITKYVINVLQPSAFAGATFRLGAYVRLYDDWTNQVLMDYTADATVRGERIITTLGVTGNPITDTFELNGVGITELPTNRVVAGSSVLWTFAGPALPPTGTSRAIVEVEAYTDAGLFGKVIYRQKDDTSPSPKYISYTTGGLL